jgi:3-deoxy-D-manno-octulosonate 8-phosphate phosphatase (KDO 8-P phosphatase)
MDNAVLERKLKPIRLLAMDVDGVLTDGVITLGASESGERIELKSFHVKDGLGLGLAQAAGLEIAWITGRLSPVVAQRAAELGVQHVSQWARNKRRVLTELATRLELQPEQVLYIGDDLNDSPGFEVAGVTVTVADASSFIRSRVDWVTYAPGGHGAVREVVERVLQAQGRWELAVSGFLARLNREDQPGLADAPPAQ